MIKYDYSLGPLEAYGETRHDEDESSRESLQRFGTAIVNSSLVIEMHLHLKEGRKR